MQTDVTKDLRPLATMADRVENNRINATSFRFREFCSMNPVPAHQPISQEDLTRLDHTTDGNNIPAPESSNENAELSMTTLRCCCGRPGCAYLEHNNAALGGLERDLETAARLGQVRAVLLFP